MSLRPVGVSVYAPVAGAWVELQGVGKKQLDANSYTAFDVDAGWPDTHLFINAAGYQPYSHHVSLPLDGKGKDIICATNGPTGPNILNFPPLVQLVVSLPRIIAGRSDFLVADTGARHVIVGSTELMLAWRYDLEGADAIRPVLAQRREDAAFDVEAILGCEGQEPRHLRRGHLPW